MTELDVVMKDTLSEAATGHLVLGGKNPVENLLIGRPRMFKRFDTDQLWVALIIGLVVLCIAVYRMRML